MSFEKVAKRMENRQKDIWDKAEILGKVLGAVLVPILVAVALFLWNSERTNQQTSAVMIPLALSILTKSPTDEDTEMLREWAISVINSPDDPPPLTEDAAAQISSTFRILPLPPSLIEPCAHPSEFLSEQNLEIALGRAGDELIMCNAQKQLIVEYFNSVSRVVSGEKE